MRISGAAGIIQADYGAAGFERLIHDVTDFLRVGAREGAAEYGKILGERIDGSTIDSSFPGYNTVAGYLFVGHAEVAAAVRDKGAGFLE